MVIVADLYNENVDQAASRATKYYPSLSDETCTSVHVRSFRDRSDNNSLRVVAYATYQSLLGGITLDYLFDGDGEGDQEVGIAYAGRGRSRDFLDVTGERVQKEIVGYTVKLADWLIDIDALVKDNWDFFTKGAA